jgi:L-lactate dehydrogenase complex protein LldG
MNQGIKSVPGDPMDDLFATFKAKAESVSAEVHRFATRRQALEFLLDLAGEALAAPGPEGHPAVLWADRGFLGGPDRELLAGLSGPRPGLGFQVTREDAAAALIGVSDMDWGIADTGTLVQDAQAVEQRLVSTLPPMHVALLETARIVPDLAALFRQVGPADSNYLSLITGPSRTADIERVLTIGVHGPGRLVILVVDQSWREAA